MKKILLIVLVIICLGSITACGSKTSSVKIEGVSDKFASEIGYFVKLMDEDYRNHTSKSLNNNVYNKYIRKYKEDDTLTKKEKEVLELVSWMYVELNGYKFNLKRGNKDIQRDCEENFLEFRQQFKDKYGF